METLKIAIYVLCILTSAACSYLLLRGYWRSSTRLLFWSGLCFGFLSANSFVVILDIMVFPAADLQFFRHSASLAAVGTLLFGLVWETE
ncbi:DUF5985 family protein [Mesorhizobium sp. WSM2239]|jgi:hypothetical protein|uniref:DUF5985 family protein n=2 Tax=unclassified Mesorhizobium TaxID=325217 RepID=A0AAU8DG99_9HYPH